MNNKDSNRGFFVYITSLICSGFINTVFALGFFVLLIILGVDKVESIIISLFLSGYLTAVLSPNNLSNIQKLQRRAK